MSFPYIERYHPIQYTCCELSHIAEWMDGPKLMVEWHAYKLSIPVQSDNTYRTLLVDNCASYVEDEEVRGYFTKMETYIKMLVPNAKNLFQPSDMFPIQK